MEQFLWNHHSYTISSVAANAMRVQAVNAPECGLDRYGIYHLPQQKNLPAFQPVADGLQLLDDNGAVLTTVRFEQKTNGGWTVCCTLEEDEEFYGLGDVNREQLNRRGQSFRMWVVDVNSYAPIPFLMSGRGWAILVNSTFEHYFDVGSRNQDRLEISSRFGAPDITVFTGNSYGDLLQSYTSLTGRPQMLPRWAMGLTYVCHTMSNVNDMLNEALNFRREDMPCDVIGLEPGWMSKDYDASTQKEWHPERFPIPFYATKGPNTFFGALKRLGYKLSLWLCCDYDLTWYEEVQRGEPISTRMQVNTEKTNTFYEQDTHLNVGQERLDEVKEMEKGWFDHLKKFADQGASCFKLDGAFQVIEHPDRKWGNGMDDAEAHNLYPVLYAKQMSQGFSDFTGRRSMIYSAGGYSGVQQYAATWAGDTGGGFGPMVSLMNHGLSGHSNTSCDMDVFSAEGMHFGFLQPWAQLNNWNYFRQPWFLDDSGKETFRFYDKLRYELSPYFYTAARQAYDTGMPMMRALPLMFPGDKEAAGCLNEYMLGDQLLVGSFLSRSEEETAAGKRNFYLPEGQWYDWFTKERYTGGQWLNYVPPKGMGGALFVKAGSAIPTVAVGKNIGDEPWEEYRIRVWADAEGKAEGLLYDDDGVSLEYMDNAYRKSVIHVTNGMVSVESEGSYTGMPQLRFVVQ